MSVAISNLSATWSNSANVFNAISINVTTNAYDANSKILNLKANGNSVFNISASGLVATGANTISTANGTLQKAIVQVFTSSGNYVIPDGAKVVEAFVIGAGGGGQGGNGRTGANNAKGGAGGAGGEWNYGRFTVDALGGAGTTISLTVGSAGQGGAGVIAASATENVGITGTSGGDSYFGTRVFSSGGPPGAAATGGTASVSYPVFAGNAGTNGGNGNNGAAGSQGTDTNFVVPTGGGGGGGQNATNPGTAYNGGIGGSILAGAYQTGATGGAVGTGGTSATAGSAGNSITLFGVNIGTGGGGGGGTTTTGNGGDGGAAGGYGGGGGGGGSCRVTSSRGGNGGNGGAGVIVVITHF